MTLQEAPDRSTTGLLEETLRALENAGVSHCLLRGPRAGGVPGSPREADILADARDLERLERAVTEMGFLRIASWGCGSHHFYGKVDDASGGLLKLDVVTSLRYGGRAGVLSSRALGGALGRSRMESGVRVLDPADAFLTLILHCVLDKRSMREDHARELARLAARLDTDGAAREHAANRFRAALGGGLRFRDAITAVRSGGPESLLRLRLRIAWELGRREPVESFVRWASGKCARALHRVRALGKGTAP